MLADDTCPNDKVKMNKCIRNNIRVHLGDVVRLKLVLKVVEFVWRKTFLDFFVNSSTFSKFCTGSSRVMVKVGTKSICLDKIVFRFFL